MTMKSNARGVSGALKMASTGERKKVDDNEEPKDRLAELIRKNVRPREVNTPLDAVVRFAEIDAQRMKTISELFALVLTESQTEQTNTPPAPRRRQRKRPNNVVAIDSNRGKGRVPAENGPKAS